MYFGEVFSFWFFFDFSCLLLRVRWTAYQKFHDLKYAHKILLIFFCFASEIDHFNYSKKNTEIRTRILYFYFSSFSLLLLLTDTFILFFCCCCYFLLSIVARLLLCICISSFCVWFGIVVVVGSCWIHHNLNQHI